MSNDKVWVVSSIIGFTCGIIALMLNIANHYNKEQQCKCEKPQCEAMYNIVDENGKVIKQVSKSDVDNMGKQHD